MEQAPSFFDAKFDAVLEAAAAAVAIELSEFKSAMFVVVLQM